MGRLKLSKRGQTWWVSGTINGQRIRESTGTTIQAIAEQYATTRELEAHKVQIFGEESVITFAAALNLYLDSGKSDRFLLPLLTEWGHKKIKDIKPGHVHDLCRKIYPNAGPATQNRQVITPVQAIINHAAKRGLCNAIKVERFAVEKKIPKVGNQEWLAAFVAHASPHLGALAMFMAYTGARISEAVRLEWKDIDFDNQVALLHQTKTEPRVCALPQPLIIKLANLERANDRVFRYASRNSMQTPWKTAEKKAGIEHIAPHDAGRRFFATELMQAGIDPVTVAKAGGWNSKRMVLEVYAQPSDTREAVQQVFGTKLTQPKLAVTNNKDKSGG